MAASAADDPRRRDDDRALGTQVVRPRLRRDGPWRWRYRGGGCPRPPDVPVCIRRPSGEVQSRRSRCHPSHVPHPDLCLVLVPTDDPGPGAGTGSPPTHSQVPVAGPPRRPPPRPPSQRQRGPLGGAVPPLIPPPPPHPTGGRPRPPGFVGG